ncbi:MAG: hypothetical protein RL357_1291, partial [Pseudomonadota bacterium]
IVGFDALVRETLWFFVMTHVLTP